MKFKHINKKQIVKKWIQIKCSNHNYFNNNFKIKISKYFHRQAFSTRIMAVKTMVHLCNQCQIWLKIVIKLMIKKYYHNRIDYFKNSKLKLILIYLRINIKMNLFSNVFKIKTFHFSMSRLWNNKEKKN